MRLQMGYKPGLKFLYFVNVPKQRGFGRFRGLFSKNTKIWRDFGGGGCSRWGNQWRLWCIVLLREFFVQLFCFSNQKVYICNAIANIDNL